MENHERDATGVARVQNVVYTLPYEWAAMSQALTPALERVEDGREETQLLVLTADAEAALAMAAEAVRIAGERPLNIVPATSVSRAARLLRARPAHVVLGAPAELLTLVQASALKLDAVRSLVLAWVDDLLAAGGGAMLETLLGEIPKDASRTIVVAELTPEVEALIERYARRARRVAPAAVAGDLDPTPLRFVTTAPGARPATLRRLLDEVDPESAAVYVRSGESEDEARAVLRSMGYAGPDATIRVTRGAAHPEAKLVVLYDLPANRVELHEALGAVPREAIAVIQPRQLPTLRTLAGGAPVTPHPLRAAADRARSREAAIRDALRAVLASESPTREMLALEPLLEEYDAIEIAAAALRLLEREREAARVRPAGEPARPAAGAGGAFVPVFISVGSRDGARPGDLVGAITGEAGITSANIGKIELRDTHTIVEIAREVAEQVAAKLTGTQIRGRRVQARIDLERRPSRSSERADRGARGEGRGPRGDRGDRGHRGARPDRGDRGDRGARPPRGEGRGPGAGRGQRPFGREDRPARAARPRPQNGE